MASVVTECVGLLSRFCVFGSFVSQSQDVTSAQPLMPPCDRYVMDMQMFSETNLCCRLGGIKRKESLNV